MNSTFGINNYIEVDLEKPLQLDPLEVIIAASKVGSTHSSLPVMAACTFELLASLTRSLTSTPW